MKLTGRCLRHQTNQISRAIATATRGTAQMDCSHQIRNRCAFKVLIAKKPSWAWPRDSRQQRSRRILEDSGISIKQEGGGVSDQGNPRSACDFSGGNPPLLVHRRQQVKTKRLTIKCNRKTNATPGTVAHLSLSVTGHRVNPM